MLDGEALFRAAEQDLDNEVIRLATARRRRLLIDDRVVRDALDLARLSAVVTVVTMLAALLAHWSWQTLQALIRPDNRHDGKHPKDARRRRTADPPPALYAKIAGSAPADRYVRKPAKAACSCPQAC
jgi:hypothetical protein